MKNKNVVIPVLVLVMCVLAASPLLAKSEFNELRDSISAILQDGSVKKGSKNNPEKKYQRIVKLAEKGKIKKIEPLSDQEQYNVLVYCIVNNKPLAFENLIQAGFSMKYEETVKTEDNKTQTWNLADQAADRHDEGALEIILKNKGKEVILSALKNSVKDKRIHNFQFLYEFAQKEKLLLDFKIGISKEEFVSREGDDRQDDFVDLVEYSIQLKNDEVLDYITTDAINAQKERFGEKVGKTGLMEMLSNDFNIKQNDFQYYYNFYVAKYGLTAKEKSQLLERIAHQGFNYNLANIFIDDLSKTELIDNSYYLKDSYFFPTDVFTKIIDKVEDPDLITMKINGRSGTLLGYWAISDSDRNSKKVLDNVQLMLDRHANYKESVKLSNGEIVSILEYVNENGCQEAKDMLDEKERLYKEEIERMKDYVRKFYGLK